MISDSENPRDRARLLRIHCTKEEALLWKHLRAKRFGEFKFRRQHRVDAYFADLCCVQKRLIVELDGGHHADQRDQDAASTYLQEFT
jgi:very-short-patch-repair endonuclease